MNIEKYSEQIRDLMWEIELLQSDYKNNEVFVKELTMLKDKLDDIERDMWLTSLDTIIRQPKTDKHTVKIYRHGILEDTFTLDNL